MSWVYAVSALLATLVLVPLLARIAPRLGLVDHPDLRKQHQGAVPLVGGISMGLATALTTALYGFEGGMPWSFHAVAVGMMALGLADDRLNLSSLLRFGLQAIGITMCVLASGVHLTGLGQLLGPFELSLGSWAVPFTVFGVLGIVNAINLSDGLDGLAGGLSLTTLLSFLLASALMMLDGSWTTRGIDPRLHILVLSAAIIGFLCFNARSPWRARAKVFMGDGGSLFLGFNIGWLSILLASQAGEHAFPAVAALWALIVPLYDTVGCMTRRIIEGYSPMRADRKHLHHLLMTGGMSVPATVAVLVAANAIGGLIGIAAWRADVPHWIMFAAFMVGFILYQFLSMKAWARTDALARSQPHTAEHTASRDQGSTVF